jgi:bacterioferritin
MAKNAFTDEAILRKRERRPFEGHAVTAGYGAERARVLKLLNEALATEIVCALRYRRHHFIARGIDARSTADEFLVHSNEKLGHADRLAERIVQLGGEPDFAPDTPTRRSYAEYVAGSTLVDMIEENLVAERIAIDCYREAIGLLGGRDSTSRLILKQILAVEEQHADELDELLQCLPVAA